MEGQILVTPEELKRVAGDFGNCMTQVATISQQMLEKVRSLNSTWQGEASTAFINKFNMLEDDMAKMKSMINEHVNDLNEMADVYLKAEREDTDIASALAGDVIS